MSTCCPTETKQIPEFDFSPERCSQQREEPGERVAPATRHAKKTHQDVEQQRRPDLPADRVCAVAQEIAQLQALLDLRAPESAHQQWGESPHRTEHWLSVVEGNCVVERRGGEQPETNCQSINKTMLNTIRPDALASLLGKVEPQNRKPTCERQGNFGDLSGGETKEPTRRRAWGGG